MGNPVRSDGDVDTICVEHRRPNEGGRACIVRSNRRGGSRQRCPYFRVSGKNNVASTSSSRTKLDGDVVDVASFSALDVVEIKTLHPRRRHLHNAVLLLGGI